MKLFFYSGGSREQNDELNMRLVEHLPLSSSITYIPSQSDKTRKYFQEFKDWFGYYGYKNFHYFDLDEEYDERWLPEVQKSDAIYLSGGNTSHFLYSIKRRMFDVFLREYIRKNKVLIGLSAGAMALTPNIGLASAGGDEENEYGIDTPASLGLVDFEVFPNYKSDKYYNEEDMKLVDKELRKYSSDRSYPVYAMKEGAGIIVTDDRMQFIGKVVKI